MAAGESVNGKLDDRLELYEAPEWGEALDVKPTCRFNVSDTACNLTLHVSGSFKLLS